MYTTEQTPFFLGFYGRLDLDEWFWFVVRLRNTFTFAWNFSRMHTFGVFASIVKRQVVDDKLLRVFVRVSPVDPLGNAVVHLDGG